MELIKELNESILNEEKKLRSLKSSLEIIDYVNSKEIENLNSEENAFLKKFQEESISGDFSNIFSICSLTIVSKIELYIILKHYSTSKFDWEKSYFLRVGIMNIYETIKTYNNFNQRLKSISIAKNHLPLTFEELAIKLRSFKKEKDLNSTMSNIRNSTIAHISPDFKKYYDDVKSIDNNRTVLMIRDFIKLLNDIYDLTINCLIEKPIDKEIDSIEIEKLRNILEKNIY